MFDNCPLQHIPANRPTAVFYTDGFPGEALPRFHLRNCASGFERRPEESEAGELQVARCSKVLVLLTRLWLRT